MCKVIKGTVRILMFVLNTCLWLAGIAMITIGALAIIEWPEYEYIFQGESLVFTVSILTIVAGSLLFLVGFSGCLGAWTENTCLLSSYFAFIILLTILQVTSGVLILLYSDEVVTDVEEALTFAFGNYSTEAAARDAVNYIQSEHECCGLKGPDYWENYTMPTIEPTPRPTDPLESCFESEDDEDPYEEGCIDSFGNYIKFVCNLLGGLTIGFLLFNVIAMVFACCMINAIKGNSNAVSPE